MTQSIDSKGFQPIPWKSLLTETVGFIKDFNPTLGGFFLLFFVLSLLSQSQEFDWSGLTPFQIWKSITFFLVLIATSYFTFVVFVLWVRGEVGKAAKVTLGQNLKTASALLLPLTILSVRGAVLLLFGLILLIVPGLYFSFKYELASYCLILEGWKDESPPVFRAEQVISKYRFALLFLAGLMLIEWLFPMLLEFSLKGTVAVPVAMKVGVAVVEALLNVLIDIYITLTILYLVKQR